jgi:Zn-dependent membrane protease YugP
MFFDPTYMLLMVFMAGITFFAQWRVKSAFAKWSQVPNEKGLSGADTARAIMQAKGLEYVGVQHVAGQLTDFYDPRNKTINLSDSSTGQPSVAAMAVVAHELGHAEQDKTGYGMMRLRASLVPTANIGSRLGIWLVIGGIVIAGLSKTGGTSWGIYVAYLGIFMFALAVAFHVVTLPVEFDASKRAKRNLNELGLVSVHEAQGVNDVLNAAALTYVAAAAVSVLQLLYWLSRVQGRRR